MGITDLAALGSTTGGVGTWLGTESATERGAYEYIVPYNALITELAHGDPFVGNLMVFAIFWYVLNWG